MPGLLVGGALQHKCDCSELSVRREAADSIMICFESDQSVGRTKDCGVNLHLLQGITLGLFCKVLQVMQWNHRAAHSWVQSHEDSGIGGHVAAGPQTQQACHEIMSEGPVQAREQRGSSQRCGPRRQSS